MIGSEMVVDMQHHYIPAEALQHVGKTREYDFSVTLQRFRKAYQVMTDIEADLRYMDEAGIDAAILSTGSFVSNGYEFCRVCNTGYGKVVRNYPERFRGMIHIDPLDDAARNTDEIRRSVNELGLFGLALVSSYGEITLDDPVLDPLYESAVRFDMPIFVHPTIRTDLWGGNRYDMYTTISREYDILKSFVELLHGVLPRFPDLKIVMAHLGGGFPTIKGRMLAWHQPTHIEIPQDYRRHGLSIRQAEELGLVADFESKCKNVLFDSAGIGGWSPVIRAAFETLGADHLCFGTDYPYELAQAPYARKVLTDIDGLTIDDVDKRKFLSGNLRRMFRF
ncbi:MAG: amidohydrolase [Lautropia sp.]|nr:MAG: amidohydrolase [Pseudomonadota bacterium]MBC6959689.1 amidohydrolase [Lautropia sp.]MCL4701577.1 amidohydrolase family protein [Burkholderiaceae bacterium]MDL1906203.1 amidohydrolase [Betaproteobacteria bacterium PRO1]RIK91520.1 MAG: hypothetical protein DCC70_00745 [Burkholderiales bacterium]